MTGENAAPAEMPGVEEIARAIADNSGWRDAEPDARNAAYYLRLARVILNLFAPILADKGLHHTTGERITRKDLNNAHRKGAEEGRLAAHLIDSVNSPLNACCYRDECRALEARALAAEAALAGARSNLEKARSDYDNLYEEYEAMSDLSFNRGSLLDEIGRDIWEPAAQRLAQIAAPGAAMEAQ